MKVGPANFVHVGASRIASILFTIRTAGFPSDTLPCILTRQNNAFQLKMCYSLINMFVFIGQSVVQNVTHRNGRRLVDHDHVVVHVDDANVLLRNRNLVSEKKNK